MVTNLPSNEWRNQKPVMVMEATALGSIGVIRSLGRAGYPVHACSSNHNALGLSSKFASDRAVHPDYDDDAFLPWLRNYCREQNISVIVPSEGFLHAIRSAYEEFIPLIPVSNDPSIVYHCMSKCDTFKGLLDAPPDSQLASNIPDTVVIEEQTNLEDPQLLQALGLPMFIKVDSAHSPGNLDNRVIKADTVEEAHATISELRHGYTKILVQSFVPGTKVAADFCVHEGEVIVETMWEARHEAPHRGGMASLRHLCWHQDIHDDALRKMQHLKWEGAAMFEYRRDIQTGNFYFIECNARYWGGLHAEMFAGVDIPRIQIDRFLGGPAEPNLPATQSVTCRHTVPGEITYVVSRLRDSELSVSKKLWSFMEFFLLFLNPKAKSDLYFPGDRVLYFIQWKRFVGEIFRRS